MGNKSREQLAKDLFGVSLDTLESTPQRALKFLRGVGTCLAIRAALQQRGYTPATNNEAWTLLQRTAGRIAPEGDVDAFDPQVAAAIEQVDPQDELILEVISASIAPRFADQAAYLVEGLTAATGMAAVLNVRTLLARMDDLEKSPERKSTRKKDQGALELLAVRGVTPALRADLAARVKVATSAAPVQPVDEASIQASDEAYVRAIGELRIWYEEWSRIARITIKRRDHLMLLGLAHAKAKKGEPEDPETPVNP